MTTIIICCYGDVYEVVSGDVYELDNVMGVTKVLPTQSKQ